MSVLGSVLRVPRAVSLSCRLVAGTAHDAPSTAAQEVRLLHLDLPDAVLVPDKHGRLEQCVYSPYNGVEQPKGTMIYHSIWPESRRLYTLHSGPRSG